MPLREQPYIPLYIKDFLTDEKLRECSAASVGVYIMLMCVMHKQEEYGTITLRSKDKQGEDIFEGFAVKLARHLPFEQPVIKAGLQELVAEGVLLLQDNMLIQKRMVKDDDISRKRAEAGKKGADTTNANFAVAKLSANIVATETESRQEPEKPQKPKRKSILSAEQQVLFEKFYATYPKKVDRATAERAWAKIMPDEEMTQKIIQAVEAAKKYDNRFRERQYIPNPASWLNAKGYLNEYAQEGGNNYGGFNSDSSRDGGEFKPSRGFKRGK